MCSYIQSFSTDPLDFFLRGKFIPKIAIYFAILAAGDRVYNTWPVAALTQAVKPDIGSKSRFLPTSPAFDDPLGGSSRNIAMPFGTEN